MKIMILMDLAIFISIIAVDVKRNLADFAEIQKLTIWESLRFVQSLLSCPRKKLMLSVLLDYACVQDARFQLNIKVDVTIWNVKTQFVRIIGAGDAISFC